MLKNLLPGRLAALTCVLALARGAAGAPRDPAAAEALFADAQRAMEQGDYASACPKLEESYRLDPATGALFAVALCHEQQGRLARAWVEFMEVASRAQEEGYPEREKDAREHASALHPRLSFLTVRVDAVTAALEGLVVARDGVRLGPAAWGTAIPSDPGVHVIEVSAPGYEPWKSTIALGREPQKETVTVPRLVPSREKSNREPQGHSEFEFTPLRVTGIGLGAAGLGALGVSAYASLRAIAKYDDSENDCTKDDVCGVAGDRDRTSARESAAIATVSAVAGGALLAAGAVVYLLGAPDEKHSLRVELEPSLASIALQGKF